MAKLTMPVRVTKFIHLRTTDFDEVAAEFPWQDQCYYQIGRGQFYGGMRLVRMGGISPFEVFGNLPIRAQGVAPPSCYTLATVQTCNMKAVWRGRTYDPGTIVFYRPGEFMDLCTPNGYRTTGLLVDLSLMPDIRRTHIVAPQLCGTFHGEIHPTLKRMDAGSDDVFHLYDFLLDWLILVAQVAASTAECPAPLGMRHRAAVFHRAERYMLANLDRAVTLKDLCGAVDVSARTLNDSFQGHLGVSPKAYFKRLQLNELRHALRAACPDQSVFEIAERWSMKYSSALASAYKALFGELPRQTLTRFPKPDEEVRPLRPVDIAPR